MREGVVRLTASPRRGKPHGCARGREEHAKWIYFLFHTRTISNIVTVLYAGGVIYPSRIYDSEMHLTGEKCNAHVKRGLVATCARAGACADSVSGPQAREGAPESC